MKEQLRYRLLAAQLEMARQASRSVLLVVTGHAATGKARLVNEINHRLENRLTEVHALAPSSEERARPYWWRNWRRLPADGRFAIFDRSWYGRVLVERVEGLATPAQWQRAYDEIRRFEQRLLAHGAVLGKLFLAIDKDEQLRRFEARAATPHKRHKLTDEDWRNRERWDDYCRAIDEMFARTHDDGAAWALIEANDKRRARLAALAHVNALLERRLDEPR